MSQVELFLLNLFKDINPVVIDWAEQACWMFEENMAHLARELALWSTEITSVDLFESLIVHWYLSGNTFYTDKACS